MAYAVTTFDAILDTSATARNSVTLNTILDGPRAGSEMAPGRDRRRKTCSARALLKGLCNAAPMVTLTFP